MTNTLETNYFLTAATLLSAFKRTDNEEQWCLATHEDDELTDFIRDLHDGELPNDWRYDTIHWIISAIASEPLERDDDWSDIPFEYADNQVDMMTSSIFQWYANYSGRYSYVQDNLEDGITHNSNDAFDQLKLGQFRAIQEMTSTILFKLNLI